MATRTPSRRLVYLGIGVVFFLLLGAFALFPVCDEQLTESGKLINVCRHVATTDPPVVLLGVLVLVMLSSFYVEISGFGVTLKSRMDNLEQQREEDKVKTDDLQLTVSDLTDFNRERVVPQVLGPRVAMAATEPEAESTSEQVPDPRVAELVNEYNTLRWTEPSGHERTQKMNTVVTRLQNALRGATDFDVAGHLGHPDRGVRLAAFAYLQIHARPDMASTIVEQAVREDKPFGQCSALRATFHQVTMGAHLTEDDRRALRELRTGAGHKNDRGQLIRKLLGED